MKGDREMKETVIAIEGIGIAIAVQISWGLNHSILWAAWHGFLGWFYVIYRGLIIGVY